MNFDLASNAPTFMIVVDRWDVTAIRRTLDRIEAILEGRSAAGARSSY